MVMGQPRTVGPAAIRYWRVMWICTVASIFIGGLIARPLGLSMFVTMGTIAALLFLGTLPLGLAARKERIERDGGQS